MPNYLREHRCTPHPLLQSNFYPIDNSNDSKFLNGSEIHLVPNEDLTESIPLDSLRTLLEELQKTSGIIFLGIFRSYLNIVGHRTDLLIKRGVKVNPHPMVPL